MPMKIVILEDSPERQAAMLDCLQDRFYQFEKRFFAGAAEMVAYLKDNLAQTIAVSLDHDLDLIRTPAGETLDCGTGRIVADFLAQHPPRCPVIIHTTNSSAATGMEMVLQDAGWKTFRVHPCGDLEWIPTTWFQTMRRAIVGSVKQNDRAAAKS
jgi:hypothetical protein